LEWELLHENGWKLESKTSSSRFLYRTQWLLSDVISTNAGTSCADGDLTMNSKCYTKFDDDQLTWYKASKKCVSRGGSLAVFTDIGRPSDSSQLTDWLRTSGTSKTYWIGLIKSWWKATDESNSWIILLLTVYLFVCIFNNIISVVLVRFSVSTNQKCPYHGLLCRTV